MSALLFPPSTGVQMPWLPSDNNLQVATSDPYLAISASVVSAGVLYLTKQPLRAPVTLNNMWLAMSAAGSGASSGSYVGAYSPAGALLGQSADIGSSFVSGNGGVQCPLTAPLYISWPFYWTGTLFNLASTQPDLYRAGGGQFLYPNLGLTASTYRFAVNGTGLTQLPASINPASNASTGGINIWTGGS